MILIRLELENKYLMGDVGHLIKAKKEECALFLFAYRIYDKIELIGG